jgi:uncharacterized membrane protein
LELSSSLLAIGLAITVIGVVMVYVSLRAGPGEARSGGAVVLFVGPVPIVLSGGRRWVLVAFAATAIIILVMVVRSAQPGLVGW